MFRMILYAVAGFFLWQIVRFFLRQFTETVAPPQRHEKVSGDAFGNRAPNRDRSSRTLDAIEDAEYQEIESKPKS
jgi:hypothetical protein